MKTVASLDGTSIAFERGGDGPPIIFVFGAFSDHKRAVPLASALQPRFTTYVYDRSGRGSSGDHQPYAVQREIEDIDALIRDAGGPVLVFGHSSGATLALHAAASGSNITEMVLYEPPFVVDSSRPRPPADLAAQIVQLVSSDRRGAAVELFQLKGVGLSEEGGRAAEERAKSSGPRGDGAHPRLRRATHRRLVASRRAGRIGYDPDIGRLWGGEPAVPTKRRPCCCRRSPQRRAPLAPRADP